jgi:hypothetical protein
MAAPTQGQGDAGKLPGAVVEELLANDRRELLLRILRERGEPMVVEDLARAVCLAETAPDDPPVDEGRQRAVRTDIFERHLPKLTAVDAVQYDSMVGTVEYVGAGELCDRLET